MKYNNGEHVNEEEISDKLSVHTEDLRSKHTNKQPPCHQH